ncbi:kinase-like domain-containing protein [Pyronema domesticum]|uniref:ethanolamine kinase n=1 Tax=Pyronema omphalodes (strain CBS 100304) TaxID=1076935 RepID=U4LJ58_PYROM|nr:kinase-like domain-containing protein [Pyronema domesticum]CCX12344.1 Similar to Ethanolamine kinase 1; acc. no. Q9D4V0 [Pyronema omphalodes CBS 100304]
MSQTEELLNIPLAYNPANSQTSASHLVYSLFPEWTPQKGGRGVKFIRFTDGITNTLLKCVHKPPPGLSPQEAKAFEDENSVLLRAYGNDTSILIDRDRECTSHLLLSKHGLAPPLLARFANGLLYRFVAGRVCSVEDLADREVWTAVAERLGEWHGILPTHPAGQTSGSEVNDLWGVMSRWIDALPSHNDETKAQKSELRRELENLQCAKKNGGYGLKGQDGGVGLVTGHCDLLNGNVIKLPGDGKKVHFIDYEYSTPCERAFDIANHFAEWGGFACDYEKLPTRGVRRDFIRAYLRSFHEHRKDGVQVTEEEIEGLMQEVDLYRGVPGFYWGIWALIQATISQIDFDYAQYALVRLGEFHAWRDSSDTPRERRWASEEIATIDVTVQN